ncbi:hypothetical protein MTO96_029706 [Rhipicephalus appendiculatus]
MSCVNRRFNEPQPTRAEPAVEPDVPPPSVVDSTHGISGGTNFGFGMRLSGRRTSQTIVAQSDQSRDPEVQAEERPTASPRHRSRYHTTRRTRRPTLSIESEFPDFPVTRAPHRAAAGLPSKRRRVKAPPHLSSPFPQRPIYQLPGFNPGQGPPVPQHYFPPLGAPFVPQNRSFVEDIPVPGQPRVPQGPQAPSQRNRTSQAFPLPVQRSFVDASVAAQGGFGQQRPALANPFPSVQPAHVFGPPHGSVPQFGGFPNQYPGAPFRGAPTPGLVDPQFRGQTPLTLPNQAAVAASQTTPSHQRNSFVTEATPGGTQANDLGTTPLSLSSASTAAENQYGDDVGTTLQLPTPAPPSASPLSTLSGERTTSAPFEYQTSRPSVLQYQTPSRPSEQFATSPAVPLYQTTPRPSPQFQQSLEPQQRTTPAPESQPSAPGAPPSSQSQFRLGTPQQQQQNTIGAQPQFNSIGGAQQGYDPYQQQFGGGYQVGNNLFGPVQQTSQDLGGGYQYPDAGPFQAQFGGALSASIYHRR